MSILGLSSQRKLSYSEYATQIKIGERDENYKYMHTKCHIEKVEVHEYGME